MKRMLNKKSSLYAFLKSSGVLDNGTHEEIQSKRKEYWNEYKRKWRKIKRKSEKEFTISFSVDELKELLIEAKRHKLSRTRFIKQSCLAYMNKRYIVPDAMEVKRISQLLSMTYNSIQEMFEEDKIDKSAGKEILKRILKLEREILPALQNPKSINEA
ncbi:MAG: hypothetical protein U0V49_02140 [Saprospiraceae bacterium]